MNKEQQRIKIAEACGYGGYIPLRNSLGGPNCHLPDYLNDLNAMHEAEKVLTEKQSTLFDSALLTIQGFNRDIDFVDEDGKATDDFVKLVKALRHANAAQRAEAFLKTLNLWEE